MSVVKINAISVPAEGREELERRFAGRAGTIESSPGFISYQLLRPVQGDDRYFIVTEWTDDASFKAWRETYTWQTHSGHQGRPVASGTALLEFEVISTVRGG